MMAFKHALSLLSVANVAVATVKSGGVFNVSLSEIFAHHPKQGNQYYDEGYFIQLSIGSPPQNFTLIADTGSPDTWVQDTILGDGGPVFQPAKSSSFINLTKPWVFDYGGPDLEFSTNVTGYAARDTVDLGGLKLTNETFAVATASYGQPGKFAQGIFGLTYNARVSSYNAPVFVQQAVKRGLLAAEMFGVRLTRAQDSKTPLRPRATLRQNGGTITLGGIDESQFNGPISYAPVQQKKGFWQIEIDGIYVNDELVESTVNFASAVDTGTSILVIPPSLAKDFYDHLGGTPQGPIAWSVPCNTTIDVKVKIGGAFFPIKAQDMNGGYIDSTLKDCYVNVFGANATNASKNGTYPSKNTDVIILGLPLLLNTYTVFDYTNGGRVGFAILVDDGPLPAAAPIDVAQNTSKISKKGEGQYEEWTPQKVGRRV